VRAGHVFRYDPAVHSQRLRGRGPSTNGTEDFQSFQNFGSLRSSPFTVSSSKIPQSFIVSDPSSVVYLLRSSLSSHPHTARMLSLNVPPGANFRSNRALPMVKPQAPASHTSAMRVTESIEPAATIGTWVAFTTAFSRARASPAPPGSGHAPRSPRSHRR
jgi:hypothetical protein